MTKADDVPEWALGLLREAAVKLRDCQGERVSKDYGSNTLRRIDAYLAAHEPAPVDPLAAIIREEFDYLITLDDSDLLPIVARLRARSVTLDTGGEG